MRRLFVPPCHGQTFSTEDVIGLDESEQHYATRVLRLGPGELIELLDGSGLKAEAELVALTPKTLGARITQPFAMCPQLVDRPEVTVAVCAPKGERADWMVEKLAEQGVARLVWLKTQRSVVVLKPAQKERLQRVMRAAVRQARHGRLPQMQGPIEWPDFISQQENLAAERWLLDAQGELPSGPVGKTPQILVIGPEGGFTPEELQLAQQAAYTSLSLGPHILRVETAAIVAAGVWGILANDNRRT